MLKNYILKIFIVLFVIGLDLISKHFFYGSSLTFLPGLISSRPTGLNTGGAWSIFSDKTWLLIAITIVFIIGFIIFEIKFKCAHPLYTISISLLLGGTIGNLIDRLIFGGVRDFIFFDFWVTYPTFNLADCFILFGIILLVVFLFFCYKPNENKK